MSRKHFVAIAKVLRAQRMEMGLRAHRLLVDEMANALGQFNPHFDRARFIDASTAVTAEGVNHG